MMHHRSNRSLRPGHILLLVVGTLALILSIFLAIWGRDILTSSDGTAAATTQDSPLRRPTSNVTLCDCQRSKDSKVCTGSAFTIDMQKRWKVCLHDMLVSFKIANADYLDTRKGCIQPKPVHIHRKISMRGIIVSRHLPHHCLLPP